MTLYRLLSVLQDGQGLPVAKGEMSCWTFAQSDSALSSQIILPGAGHSGV
jgi:hypothetical protein